MARFLLFAAGLAASAASAQTLTTPEGPVEVRDWGYQLQGSPRDPLDPQTLAAAPHDLLVVDFSRDGREATRFTPDEVKTMQRREGGRRRVVVAYLSIGEASEFRAHWRREWTRTGRARSRLTPAAPAWLGPVNPDWPESRKVRYWDPDWRRVLVNTEGTGWLDQIVAQGFDGAYLDIVDAYFFWGAEAKPSDRRAGDPVDEQDAARRMAALIVALAEHARRSAPDFFLIPQNGAFLVNDLRHGDEPAEDDEKLIAQYYDAIGAIANEDTYYRGDADENNPLDVDDEKVEVLKREFLGMGKPVLVVDYLNQPAETADFERRVRADGFLPYAAPTRGLDRLGPPAVSE